MNPVYSIHLRLHRAYEHLDALNRETEAFLRSKPYSFWREDNLEERSAVWRMEIFDPPPLKLSLIVADCISNMRSALDYLMWQLVTNYKAGRPSTRTQFPLCTSCESWNKVKRAIRYLPEEVIKYLEILQPYQATERGAPAGQRTILRLLHDLCNREKHRELSELCFLVSIDFEPSPADYRFEIGQATIREGSAVVARAFPLTPDAQPKIDAHAAIKIALGDRPKDGVMETLTLIHNGISDTLLPPFERFLLGS